MCFVHNETNFLQAKLDSQIDVLFLLNEHGNLSQVYRIIIVYVLSSLIKKKNILYRTKKDIGESAQKTVTLECKLWPQKQRLYERFPSTSF